MPRLEAPDRTIRPAAHLGKSMQDADPFSYKAADNFASLVAQLVKNRLQCGDLGSIPGLGRSPGEGKG